MSEPRKKSFVSRIITAVFICLLVGFVIVIVIPTFIRARHQTAANACINNLRQIDGAKQQGALENGKTNGVVTESDIKPYLGSGPNGYMPKCPAGGTYTVGRVGEDPKCSISTSAWPNDHVLNPTNNWWTDFKAAYSIVLGQHHARLSAK